MLDEDASLPTLEQFLFGRLRNSHVRDARFSTLYMRKGSRYLCGTFCANVVDVANIAAVKPGGGAFKSLLADLYRLRPGWTLYVESVLNPWFGEYLSGLGFQREPRSEPPSYWKVLVPAGGGQRLLAHLAGDLEESELRRVALGDVKDVGADRFYREVALEYLNRGDDSYALILAVWDDPEGRPRRGELLDALVAGRYDCTVDYVRFLEYLLSDDCTEGAAESLAVVLSACMADRGLSEEERSAVQADLSERVSHLPWGTRALTAIRELCALQGDGSDWSQRVGL